MGAHRRQIVRRRNPNSAKRRDNKILPSETASEHGSWETGSEKTTLSGLEHYSHNSSSSQGSPLLPLKQAKDSCRLGDERSVDSNQDLAKGASSGFPSLRALGGDTKYYGALRYPYRPDTGGPGYAGDLSSFQEAALGAIRQWLTRESVDLSPVLGDGALCPPEDEDLALLRFLRRNSWDVEQTRVQLEDNLTWRAETGVVEALRKRPWQVAGCANEETFASLCKSYYPHYTLGSDRLGRPILVQKYGNFDTTKLRQCTTMDDLVNYHAWEQEKNAELLRRATARTGYLVETFTLIMDFKGMGIGLVNRDFLWLLKQLSDIDRKFYSGRGGVTFIINTPPLFGFVWQGIRGFMEATQARIHIFGSNEDEWKAALTEAIDPARLPPEYGGTATDLEGTPFLPELHGALDRDSLAKAATDGRASCGRDRAEPHAEDEVTSAAMAALVECFSLRAGDEMSDRANIAAKGEERSDSAGGSPVAFGGGGGPESSGAVAGGGRPCLARTGSARKQRDDAGKRVGKTITGQMSPDRTSASRPGDHVVWQRIERSPCDNTMALSGGMPGASASQLGVDDQDSQQQPHEDREEDHLSWILDVIPGARFAASVAGTATGLALGATLGAAGVAASVVEAVVPDRMWADAVEAFQASQSAGRWALGR